MNRVRAAVKRNPPALERVRHRIGRAPAENEEEPAGMKRLFGAMAALAGLALCAVPGAAEGSAARTATATAAAPVPDTRAAGSRAEAGAGKARTPWIPMPIADTIRVEEWQYLGPFSTGYREGIVGAIPDPGRLTPPGSALRRAPSTDREESGNRAGGNSSAPRQPPGSLRLGAPAAEYPSVLARGGFVAWKSARADSAGWVNIEFNDISWDTLMDVYGYAGLVNRTFAYAEVHSPGARRALAVAEHAGTFYLNGLEHQGDPYGHDFMRVPVLLEKGINTVVVSLSGFGGHRFRFELIPAPAPVILLNDYTAPDLIEHETGRFWTGITVVNTTPRWIHGAVLHVGQGAWAGSGHIPADSGPTAVDLAWTTVDPGHTPACSDPKTVDSASTPADSGPAPVDSGPTPADSGPTQAESGHAPAGPGPRPAVPGRLPAAYGGPRVVPTVLQVGSLAPLCVKKIPVPMVVTWTSGASEGEHPGTPAEKSRAATPGQSQAAPPGESPDMPESSVRDLWVPVSVEHLGVAHEDSMHIRVRSPGQSLKRTFISEIDSSCQYFAVLPPSEFQPGREYALILTLHGAGVRAEGQVDAYKPKPWAYVVAPTNRRPFGFDWQDWGRLDALEVLGTAMQMLPIDTSRVYLTGHSMGGHGVWHVGLSHPGLFAAIAPEAGWTSFELYIPWFLQRAYMYGDPRAVGMRDLALREDRALDFVENALNLGVLIVHGGEDDNVPALHGRMFARRLSELGYSYEYWEAPGRGHWWHDDSLDVSCVDHPRVMDFLESRERTAPYSVRLKTVNLATSNTAYWVEVTAQEEPMRETEISAAMIAGPRSGLETPRIMVSTTNVAAFNLHPPPELLPPGRVEVSVDGERESQLVRVDGGPIAFARRAGRWRPGPMERKGLAKSGGLYGPIKQAYFSPFMLVYGTAGGRAGAGTAEILLHQARSQAMRWWRRGNGCVEVVPDSLVTDGMVARYNLILFGGPAENSVTARIARGLPLKVVPHAGGRRGKLGGIQIGPHLIKGWGLAAEFVYPNPLNPEKLVLVHMGTDAAGLGISDFFSTLHAGAGLPDYIVFDDEVRRMGWAGVLCAGYFDTAWRVDPGLMYRAPD